MEERTQLKQARKDRKLKQRQVAEAIKCSEDSISLWERGLADPQQHWVNELCTFYDKRPAELDLGPLPQITEGQIAMLQKILGNVHLDRRQALELVTQVPALAALVEVLAVPSSGIVAPEQFLSQCTAAIKVCWKLLDSGGYADVEDILTSNIPTLQSLVTQSKYQDEASSLLTQAKIMQTHLATRNRDFAKRRVLCLEAVQFGELSGDPFLHTRALYWHGDTYVYCYHQPNKAIGIIKDALSHVNGDMLLSRVGLCSNLAIAHAQLGDETHALDYVEQARKAMPKYPEQDPVYQYGGWDSGNLDKLTGRMYLDLAEHLPDYAQKAYKTLGQGVSKYTHQGGLCQTLIHQADAARVMGDLHEYARCLEKGWLIAITFTGKIRQHEALTVLQKAPEAWKKERKYQDLVKMF